jgi:hypothetical protein
MGRVTRAILQASIAVGLFQLLFRLLPIASCVLPTRSYCLPFKSLHSV